MSSRSIVSAAYFAPRFFGAELFRPRVLSTAELIRILMRKQGVLIKWDVQGRVSEGKFDGFVQQGLRTDSTAPIRFFSSDDVQSNLNTLKLGVVLTYKEKWDRERRMYVATDLKQKGAGTRATTMCEDASEAKSFATEAEARKEGARLMRVIVKVSRELGVEALWERGAAQGVERSRSPRGRRGVHPGDDPHVGAEPDDGEKDEEETDEEYKENDDEEHDEEDGDEEDEKEDNDNARDLQ